MGWARNGYSYVYSGSAVGEREQARGLSAPTGVALVKGAQRAATAKREGGFQNLGSGARALRKYACDTNTIREIMHASDGMGCATAIARIVRRARVNKGN
eukprot:6214733-Pleurochrysis_carterae.AAC.1